MVWHCYKLRNTIIGFNKYSINAVKQNCSDEIHEQKTQENTFLSAQKIIPVSNETKSTPVFGEQTHIVKKSTQPKRKMCKNL